MIEAGLCNEIEDSNEGNCMIAEAVMTINLRLYMCVCMRLLHGYVYLWYIYSKNCYLNLRYTFFEIFIVSVSSTRSVIKVELQRSSD